MVGAMVQLIKIQQDEVIQNHTAGFFRINGDFCHNSNLSCPSCGKGFGNEFQDRNYYSKNWK